MSDRLILMGVIGKPHGVRGAVHVHVYAEDPDALADLPLHGGDGRRFRLVWTGEGIARIAEVGEAGERAVADRDAAARLTNTRLFVERADLPPPDEDEFYLADLIGLAAVGIDGEKLGTVTAVHDYGAGASLELDGGTLLPFTKAAVPGIDLAAGVVTVAPPAEIEVRS